MAVPGLPDALLQSQDGEGAGAAPALQWRRNSPARQQHKGNSDSPVGTPVGMGTVAAQQN